MKRQQIPIPGTASFGPHAGLLSRGNLHYRSSRHRNSSLIVAIVSPLLIYQRVRLCANLLWFDLVAADGPGRRGSVAGAGDCRGAAALTEYQGRGLEPEGLSLTPSAQSQTAEKDPRTRRDFCQSQQKTRPVRLPQGASG